MPMTDHNMEVTKVLLGEPMNFIGVTYRTIRIYISNCMSQGLHTDMKWFKDSCIIKAIPILMKVYKNWKPWTYYTARWFTWSELLLGISASLCFFQVAGLLSLHNLVHLSLSKQSLLLMHSWRGTDLVNLLYFRDFLKYFELFTSCLNETFLQHKILPSP